MRKVLDYGLKYLFSIIYFGIFLLCIFGVAKINYAYKLDISENNLLTFVVSLFIFLLFFYARKISTVSKSRRILVFISILLFIFQILLINFYYFKTDWDVKTVLTVAEKLANKEQIIEWNRDYYSYYPNNLFVTILFSKIIIFCNFIGLHTYAYLIILIIQSLLNIITGILLFLTLEKILNKVIFSYIGYVFYVLLIWISPWVSIPYTDSMGLVFPVLILYLYVSLNAHVYKKIAVIGVLSSIVYGIKPQTIIIIIAIVIVTIFYKETDNIKKLVKNSVIFIFMAVVSVIGVKYFVHSSPIKIDTEKEISYTHFIKMGLNNQTDGGYLAEDVYGSMEMETKSEREKENLDVIKNRMADYGIGGLFKHQVKKTLNNYNDGTFGWGLEGTFYYEIIENNSTLAKYIRNFYYNEGNYYSYFKYIAQGTWLVVLFLIIGNVFEKVEKMTKEKKIIYLSLIGIFLFESIFESRSRYLYTYTPIFIIAAMIGLDNILRKLNLVD